MHEAVRQILPSEELPNKAQRFLPGREHNTISILDQAQQELERDTKFKCGLPLAILLLIDVT